MIERELPQRLDILCEWVGELFEQLRHGGPTWANPFGRELLLVTLEKYCASSAMIRGRVRSDQTGYSAWVNKGAHSFVPVAFSGTPVWENEDRKLAMQSVADCVSDSISQYFEDVPRHSLELTPNIPLLVDSFCSEIRFYHNLGRRFHLYGGVLAIETFIRLVEERMKAVLPEVHHFLKWNYPNCDFSIQEYLQNKSEIAVERSFINHWNSYVLALPPQGTKVEENENGGEPH